MEISASLFLMSTAVIWPFKAIVRLWVAAAAADTG